MRAPPSMLTLAPKWSNGFTLDGSSFCIPPERRQKEGVENFRTSVKKRITLCYVFAGKVTATTNFNSSARWENATAVGVPTAGVGAREVMTVVGRQRTRRPKFSVLTAPFQKDDSKKRPTEKQKSFTHFLLKYKGCG